MERLGLKLCWNVVLGMNELIKAKFTTISDGAEVVRASEIASKAQMNRAFIDWRLISDNPAGSGRSVYNSKLREPRQLSIENPLVLAPARQTELYRAEY